MKLSDDLAWRGLIKDKTFNDISWLDKRQTFYHGVDPSADSLHIGNLMALITARRLIDGGWKAVLLVGGGTSLIGDPGGKFEERKLISREDVKHNAEAIKRQVSKLFSGQDFTLVDNYKWFSEIKYLDFLREYGKRFSMTELMQREFVTERMGEGGSGITYAEFSYGLVQGYDFYRLNAKEGLDVVLQIGGSDQWSNMLMGVSMIRKKEGTEVHALSMPLVVNKATGTKFGKSEGGAIWLDPAKTSPTQFYQFWINAGDADVEDYLKIFTFLSKDAIEKVMAEHKADPGKRAAQKALAEQVTKLVHGEASSGSATGVSKYLTHSTGSGQAGQVSIGEASEAELELIRKEIPSFKTTKDSSIIEALAQTGLASSNSDARRLLASGAVYINDQNIEHENFEESDFQNGRLLLRRGKAYKDSALIELE